MNLDTRVNCRCVRPKCERGQKLESPWETSQGSVAVSREEGFLDCQICHYYNIKEKTYKSGYIKLHSSCF